MSKSKDENIPVSSYFPPKLYEKLKESAKRNRRSISSQVVYLVEKSLD